MPQTTCKTIRHLRMQKRRKCGSCGQGLQKSIQETRTVNIINLWHLKHTEVLTRTDPFCNFSLTLVNMQSLENKNTVLLDHLIGKKTAIYIVTETWFMENYMTWLECSDISRNGYKILTHNRNIRKGEGLAIVYRSNLKVSAIETYHTRSMEYGIWKVNTGTVTINIIAIYHPP